MKKQTKHSIKAHLLWSALILLALLAVCAIPFTLAQSRSRGTTKQTVAIPNVPANVFRQCRRVSGMRWILLGSVVYCTTALALFDAGRVLSVCSQGMYFLQLDSRQLAQVIYSVTNSYICRQYSTEEMLSV